MDGGAAVNLSLPAVNLIMFLAVFTKGRLFHVKREALPSTARRPATTKRFGSGEPNRKTIRVGSVGAAEVAQGVTWQCA